MANRISGRDMNASRFVTYGAAIVVLLLVGLGLLWSFLVVPVGDDQTGVVVSEDELVTTLEPGWHLRTRHEGRIVRYPTEQSFQYQGWDEEFVFRGRDARRIDFTIEWRIDDLDAMVAEFGAAPPDIEALEARVADAMESRLRLEIAQVDDLAAITEKPERMHVMRQRLGRELEEMGLVLVDLEIALSEPEGS